MAPMWSSPAAPPPPPSASPRNNASSLSANNALFLIAFGMFLVVSVLPALVAALVKLAVLATAVLLIAAATNPSDYSFACWVSSQENIRMRDASSSGSVSQWFSAVVKSAIAIVRNEPLVWRAHNVFVFTVVYVPAIERYALGCFGSWRWADANGYAFDLCRAPWVVKVSRGGVESSLEQYLDTPTSGVSSSRRSGAPGVRQRHTAVAAPASLPAAFADVLHAAGLSNVVASARSATPGDSGLSDRELRTRAMQFKIKKDWKDAAQAFLEAASVALSTLSKTNYRLEAAWCLLEDSDSYPDRTAQLIKMVEQVCEELVTSGYFDEASRAFAELALRLKRKFPQDLHREAFARDLALLFVQAKNAAEAGGSVRGAVENGLRAAAVYVDVGLWALAEECFETAGEMARSVDSNSAQATEALGNAVLCRIGQLDVVGAEEMLAKHARQGLTSSSSPSDMDVLLASVLKAYGKWSLQILDTACKRYDTTRRLTTWQWECLNNLRDKMTSTDLR